MSQDKRRVLVLGGTGAVGSAVVRELVHSGFSPMFTYNQAQDRAAALIEELTNESSVRAVQLDLRETSALPKLAASLEAENELPQIVIHCAAVVRQARIDVATDEDWDETMAVNGRSAFQVARELGGRMASRGGGEIVFVTALDRTQSLPIPAVFAASQGLVSALTMAAAKELGSRGVRCNAVALGLLDKGIGERLDSKLVADYQTLSALRRLGETGEVAKTIVWLALHNTYLNGKVVSVNGGI